MSLLDGLSAKLSFRAAVTAALIVSLNVWEIGCGAPAPSPGARTTVFEVPSAPAVMQTKNLPAAPVYLMHLPGVGGTRIIDEDMLGGLRAGGFKGKYEICDWSGDDPGVDALQAEARNKAKASEYAKQLTAEFDADPSAKIYMTSHSGGGGLAVWVLEALPPRVMVQSVVLLSPALSPGYDLSRALHHVAGKMYVFSSLGDLAVLGYGCRILGTMDGVKCDAAGRVGFVQPPNADPIQYQKLVAMPYQPGWRRYYNEGDHIGGMTLDFARAIVAPLLLHPMLDPPSDRAVLPTTGPVLQ